MKILHKDLKHGVMKLEVENLDDLWYLTQVLVEGDLVKTRTERRIKGKDDMVKSDAGKRETVTIEVRLEKASLDQSTGKLRLLGMITEAPSDLIAPNSHHSLEVDVGTRLEITKKWKPVELDHINEAHKAAKRPKILVCCVGDGDATIALIRESGISYVDIREAIGGKYVEGRESRKQDFYTTLAQALENQVDKNSSDKLILTGTGFEKGNFRDYLKDKNKELAKISVVVPSGSEGKGAINELMKKGEIEKITEETRISREAKLVEHLLQEISKNGLGVYGLKETGHAVSQGAVSVLLITDDYFVNERERCEGLIRNARSTGSVFHIVNSGYEAGEKLKALGGVAAILRYKTSQ